MSVSSYTWFSSGVFAGESKDAKTEIPDFLKLLGLRNASGGRLGSTNCLFYSHLKCRKDKRPCQLYT